MGKSLLGQNCDVTTPTFNVNLDGQPNGIWNSPAVIREGYCCGMSSGSDKCIQFNLILDDLTAAINFEVTSGAMPGGAMFYQVNCGPMQQVGNPVCLSGSGPFVITFCKPGNNLNTYKITAIKGPTAKGPEYISQACKGLMVASGLLESSITWQSVPNNATYNSYLSCTSSCDSVTMNPPASGAPAYIDYRVFGSLTGICTTITFTDTLRIYFLSDLAVNIFPTNPSVCEGGSNITLTANPTGGLQPYHYTWNTGGTTASISTGAGNYSVVVTDEFYCSTADTSITVTTYPSPIICNAGPDGQMCINSNFYTLNGSIVAATGGQWFGAGGFVPNSTTLNANYYPTASEISNGFADVRLVTTGNLGCPALTDTVRISIRPNPAPQISGNLQTCQFNSYRYTTPYVPGNTYQWIVNSGTIISQNADTINIKWDTTGTHLLSVREINFFGCDSVVSVNVVVNQKPSPVITPQANICEYTQHLYTVESPQAINSYSWSISGGFINDNNEDTITVKWTGSGLGSLTVIEMNFSGCDSTVSANYTIMNRPEPEISGIDSICQYNTSIYTAPYITGNQYQWSVINGNIISQTDSNVFVQWNNDGQSEITLMETGINGCDSVTSFDVFVQKTPVPQIVGPTEICTGDENIFVANNIFAGEIISWSATGGVVNGFSNTDTLTITFDSVASYTITLHVLKPSGCDSTVTHPLIVYQTPDPEITGVDSVCHNQVETYSVIYTAGQQYFWSVVNGTLVNADSNMAVIQWGGSDTGLVTVREVNEICEVSYSMPINILPALNPFLRGLMEACGGFTSIFVVDSLNENESIQWTVSGGTVSGGTVDDTLHITWPDSGNYNVDVNISNVLGCDTTLSLSVNVIPVPKPVFSGTQLVCINQTSVYTAMDTTSANYNWNVSNGTIVSQTDSSIIVNWNTAGAVNVALTATNGSCDTTIYLPVTVLPQPDPTIIGDQVVCDESIELYQATNVLPHEIISWQLTGGISFSLSNDENYFVLWNDTGFQQLNLIVSNVPGCADTIIYPVYVNLQPQSDIVGASIVCNGQVEDYSVQYNQGSTYSWTVIGGNILSQDSSIIVVDWNQSGNGSVNVSEVNNGLCVSLDQINVTVLPELSPGINGSSVVCSDATFQYTATGIAVNQTRLWEVTGGSIIGSNTGNVCNFMWNNSGNYSIQLTITNELGCDTLISYPVEVLETPEPAILGAKKICINSEVLYTTEFDSTSTYIWSIQNGNILYQNSDSIIVQWDSSGTGIISVTESNQGICTILESDTIYILPYPDPVITGPITVCSGNTYQYIVHSIDTNESVSWNVDSGLISGFADHDTLNVSWPSIGNFVIQLNATNEIGCDTIIVFPVTVIFQPTPIIAGDNIVCTDQVSTYFVDHNPGSVYNWNITLGTIISQIDTSVTVQWDGSGTGTVSLTEINTGFCDSTVNYSVTILPEINPTVTGPDTVCSGLVANYIVSGLNDGQSISWIITGGILQGSSINDTISVLWNNNNNKGGCKVSVSISNTLGCDTTIVLPIKVMYQPAPVIDGDSLICADQVSTYSVEYNANSIYTWNVLQGTIISQIDTNVTIHWNGVGTGTIFLTEINTGLCDSTVSFSVNILPEINPTISGLQTICSGLQTSYIVSGVNAGQSVSWIVTGGVLQSSSTNDTINVLWNNEGSHNVQVYISNIRSCDTTINFPVTVILQLTPVITGDNLVCTDQVSTYTVDYNVGSVYNWTITNGTVIDSTDNTITINWDGIGTGTITLTEINSGFCDSTVNFSVTILPEINPTISGLQTICLGLQTSYVVSGVNTGQSISWIVTGGVLQGSSTNDTINVLWNNEGSHNVQVYISNILSCDTTINFPVTVILQLTPVITGDNLVCTDQVSTYTVDFNSGSVYNWSVSQGIIISQIDSSVTIHWDAGGTGTITLTEINSGLCDSTVNFSVTILPEINPVVTGAPTICSGLQTSYFVSGVNAGQSISWQVTGGVLQGFSTNDTINVLWNNEGSHNGQMYISNMLGCDTIIDLPVTVIHQPTPVITGDNLVCTDEVSTYSVIYNTGSAYNWTVTNGSVIDTMDNNITIQWDGTGTGTISLTEINSILCDSTVNYSVTILPEINPVVTGVQTICLGLQTSYVVSGVNAGQSISWQVTGGVLQSSSTNDTINVLWNNEGSYNVQMHISNILSCDTVIDYPVTVIIQPSPVINGDGVVCKYQQTTYFVQFNPGSTYNWTVVNGEIVEENINTIIISWTGNNTGEIILEETNSGLCDTIVFFSVNILTQPEPILTGPLTACSSTSHTYELTNVTTPETVTWHVQGGIIESYPSSYSIKVQWFSPGTGTVNSLVINPSGCDSLVQCFVNIREGAHPVINGTNITCNNDVTIYNVEKTPGHEYLWQITGGDILTGFTDHWIEVRWKNVGQGIVSVTESSPAGCDSSVAMAVTVKPTPVTDVTGSPVVCENETAVFTIPSSVTNSYQWTVHDGNVLGSTNNSTLLCSWTQVGIYTVSVTETNPDGCNALDTFTVEVLPKPEVNLTYKNHGCINRNSKFNITKQANVDYQYVVSGGVVVSDSAGVIEVDWFSQGVKEFIVTATNSLTGCTQTDRVQVNVEEVLSPVVNPSLYSGCVPLSVDFKNTVDSSGYHYTWIFGDGSHSFDLRPVHTYIKAGTYPVSLIVANDMGCMDTTTVIIAVYPKPLADFDILNYGDKVFVEQDILRVENLSKGAVSYHWSISNGYESNSFEPSDSIMVPGFYDITLRVINTWGCIDKMTNQFEIIVPENLFIPSAFTPNGDEQNDFFKIEYLNIVELHLLIFDRWGELIYETNDVNFKWDGKHKGDYVQSSIYVYKLEAKGVYGKEFTWFGTVTVIN